MAQGTWVLHVERRGGATSEECTDSGSQTHQRHHREVRRSVHTVDPHGS